MRGFTLVEMLVVLVLLGVLATVVTVRLEQDERRVVRREATRLAAALEAAVVRAQWHGTTLGWSASDHAYRFLRRDGDGAWHVISDDEALAPRALPETLQIRAWRYAGSAVAPDAVVAFRASGRNEPLEILVTSQHSLARVTSDPLNRVSVSVELSQ